MEFSYRRESGIRNVGNRRRLAAIVLVTALSACSGKSVPFAPVVSGATSSPSPTSPATLAPATAAPSTAAPMPTATPVIAAGSMLDPAVANAAFTDAEQFYAALPHQDYGSDLSATAAHMVSSHLFASAQVTVGGISGTLPNGAAAVVYADAPEELPYGTSSSTAAQRTSPQALRAGCTASDNTPIGAAQHEVAFLVNECDARNIFDIDFHEESFAGAFSNDGFGGAGFGVDVINDTLDNIVALSGRAIDYLSLATHGAVIVNRDGSMGYINESSQAVDAASTLRYDSDIMATPPRIAYSFVLAAPFPQGLQSAVWSFTPAFVTEHVQFTPGATVYMHACDGASPSILQSVTSQYANAGVGLYYGWTKATLSTDDDGTEGFILDRLLGEQSPSVTGLDAVASQRTPPQRPFPFDDIDGALSRELRNGPFHPVNPTFYDESDGGTGNLQEPPTSDGSISHLVVMPLSPIADDQPSLVASVPSIANMKILSETSSGGTLAIEGAFPVLQGIVKITDGSGTTQLPVTSWTRTEVRVTLPQDGNGAAGMVQVFDATGSVASNAAPLTQWTGSMTYNEGDQLDALAQTAGSGPGAFGLTFALHFRSDVHPFVGTIDTQPQSQNLVFPQVEGDSTAVVSTLRGNFTSAAGTPPPDTATLALNPVSVAMHPAPLPLPANGFIAGAVPNQSPPCNNGSAGPEGDAGNVFCPAFGYTAANAGLCTDDPNNSESYCGAYTTFTTGGSFGEPGLVDPGIVQFTMDPSSYGITVFGATTSFTRIFPDNSEWPATANVSGSFSATNAPQTSSPAARSRLAK